MGLTTASHPHIEISFSNNLYIRDVQGRVFTTAGDTYTAIYHLSKLTGYNADRSKWDLQQHRIRALRSPLVTIFILLEIWFPAKLVLFRFYEMKRN
jgi:hypothetical protein